MFVFLILTGQSNAEVVKKDLEIVLQNRKIQVENWNRVQVLVGDVNDKFLGQTKEIFDNLCKEVSCIVHCAWEPNLTAPFSIQEIHLQGTKNLLEMATTHNLKEFNFISR
jgi:thioester reductase-like protein